MKRKKAKPSAAAARRRLELLAPSAADGLGDVLKSMTDVISTNEDDEVRIKAANALTKATSQILDRGGAPAVRANLIDARVRQVGGRTQRQLLKELAKKLAVLDGADLKVLGAHNPTISALLEAAPADVVDAEVVKD